MVVNLILYGLYSLRVANQRQEAFEQSRKPYFIWTIFFTLVITGISAEFMSSRKPYFIWTIFFTYTKSQF